MNVTLISPSAVNTVAKVSMRQQTIQLTEIRNVNNYDSSTMLIHIGKKKNTKYIYIYFIIIIITSANAQYNNYYLIQY